MQSGAQPSTLCGRQLWQAILRLGIEVVRQEELKPQLGNASANRIKEHRVHADLGGRVAERHQVVFRVHRPDDLGRVVREVE